MGNNKISTIISIHIPKTAGTTLSHYLRNHFNVFADNEFSAKLAQLYQLYSSYPNGSGVGIAARKWMHIGFIESILSMDSTIKKTKDYDCIHGHFNVMKYRFYPNAKFITFVREPLERAISHYYYWKKLYENGYEDLYLNYLFERNMGLNEFLFLKSFRNYQSLYLNGISLKKIDFLGISDNGFSEDVKYLFGTVLNHPLKDVEILKINVTDYTKNIENIDVDAFRKFHRKDYRIYEYALEKRKMRNCIA